MGNGILSWLHTKGTQVDKSLHAATEANNEKWVDSSIVVDFY